MAKYNGSHEQTLHCVNVASGFGYTVRCKPTLGHVRICVRRVLCRSVCRCLVWVATMCYLQNLCSSLSILLESLDVAPFI